MPSISSGTDVWCPSGSNGRASILRESGAKAPISASTMRSSGSRTIAAPSIAHQSKGGGTVVHATDAPSPTLAHRGITFDEWSSPWSLRSCNRLGRILQDSPAGCARKRRVTKSATHTRSDLRHPFQLSPSMSPRIHELVRSICSHAFLGLAVLGVLAPQASPSASCGTTCTTTKSPGAYFNETWTIAGSPYCITGNVTLANVTIDPGVCVIVDPDATITVATGLNASGTAAQPITFTASNATRGWGGLIFNSSATTSVLRHCCVEETGGASGSSTVGTAVRINNTLPTIEHCTFRRCGRDGTGGSVAGPSTGGALNIVLSGGLALLVENCVFEESFALVTGGAIQAVLDNGASLALRDCVIRHGRARRSGSGTPAGNSAGGALYVTATAGFGSVTLERCDLSDNQVNSRCDSCFCSTSASGGAVSINACDASFVNCTLMRNAVVATTNSGGGACTGTSSGSGAGIYFNAAARTLAVENCYFGGNQTTGSGPGTINSDGAGLYVANGTAHVANCTIVANQSEAIHRAAGTVSAKNCILYFNNGTGPETTGTIELSYCCVESVVPACATCPTFDPGLWGGTPPLGTNVAALRVIPFSPCVDAGDPSTALDDACLGPGHGTARSDLGAEGGPRNCDWLSFCNFDRFCTATPNSTGNTGRMEWQGSSSVAANDLVLVATGLPPNTPGLFFFGVSRVQQAFGNGYRCVNGNVVRLPPAYADPSGITTLWLDRGSIPQMSALGPGEVRSFQYWYRNPAAMPPAPSTFNLTDALEVFFCL